MKKSFSQKQIPTLIGIAILVISLIGGIALIGKGGEIFAPRAAPQTTPKKIKATNIKDDSFTVSFVTDETTTGFLKYGTAANAIKSQSGDDRDQLTGSVGQFTTHYITVRDLQPDTTYYYLLGTSSGSKFDNNGVPFEIKTAKKAGTPPIARTIYGTILNANNTPAVGAIVYVNITGAGELSALTKESGSWAVPLSSARTLDGSKFATINKDDSVLVTVQGRDIASTATASMKIEEAQPAKNIILGQNAVAENTSAASDSASITSTQESPLPIADASPSPIASPELTDANQATSSGSPFPDFTAGSNGSDSATIATQNPDFGGFGGLLSSPTPEQPTQTVVDVNSQTTQIVDTSQPVITGQAIPNVTLKIEIHSNEQITTQTTTDSTGNYVVDLESLKKDLEPGEHTVTITYTDPNTGKEVTTTKTFTVAGSSLALASTSPSPFGTSNPFPVASASASPSLEPRVSLPASSSTLPRSGSVSTTYILLFSGLFFLIAGVWSYIHTQQALREVN
jgi:hypothetical protein